MTRQSNLCPSLGTDPCTTHSCSSGPYFIWKDNTVLWACERSLRAAVRSLGSAALGWRWSVTHPAPCARSCPTKGGNGNAEAGRWFLFLFSVLVTLRARGLHRLISRFCWRCWSCRSPALVPSWVGLGVTHWKKAAVFWSQTCESSVLKVEDCRFERQSGSRHCIHQQRWRL